MCCTTVFKYLPLEGLWHRDTGAFLLARLSRSTLCVSMKLNRYPVQLSLLYVWFVNNLIGRGNEKFGASFLFLFDKLLLECSHVKLSKSQKLAEQRLVSGHHCIPDENVLVPISRNTPCISAQLNKKKIKVPSRFRDCLFYCSNPFYSLNICTVM